MRIRRLVEEATDLAVRAANGTTSSSLSNSFNAANGLLGSGGTNVLGLGRNGGGNAKLSRERKHRMRELATQKLSEAYHLDEIAASVATMQSASSLEDVAKLVLQRSPEDIDAKYVHFFHEKIPSRTLAQSTSLTPLNEVIHARPSHGSPLRTRAVTRIFKDDYLGSVRDLTEALAVCRYTTNQHKVGRGQIQLVKTLGSAEWNHGDTDGTRYGGLLAEEDKPNSLEPQLLFHRANVYLTLGCQHIENALDCLAVGGAKAGKASDVDAENVSPNRSSVKSEASEAQVRARKMVKNYAKRALKDYIGFLSFLDYTPGLPYATTEEFFCKVNALAHGVTQPRVQRTSKLLEMSGNPTLSHGDLSETLVPTRHQTDGHSQDQSFPNIFDQASLLAPKVYQVSSLFSSAPVDDLPPYPVTSQALIAKSSSTSGTNDHARFPIDRHEAITYHPLLTDALHSLLLCHTLMQTSPKEHLRHAHMVARLARICDGYPIFLAARSPSRADWIEIIRRGRNWLGLQQSWEMLCTPAPLPGQAGSANQETKEEVKERCRQEAIMEALADERVHDEASFQAAVKAREVRAEEQREEGGAKRWAQGDGREYPISSERAEAVARWVREAEVGGQMGVKKVGRGKRNGEGQGVGEKVLPVRESVE